MASIIKFLCLVVFLSIISQVTALIGGCQRGDVTIVQNPTGRLVKNKPEWKLTVENECVCTQEDVKLSCAGFQSITPVDPAIISKSGDVCTINNNQPIYGGKSVSFTYVWNQPFVFTPISSQVACS